MTEAYKIELDVYSGPLDLLLYLIQEEEVDVRDIHIARILERFIEHLEHVKHLDINLAAEFLLMASHLMEIKSKMLLPVEDRLTEDEDGEVEDPRAQLVRQLMAYRAFKEASTRLAELMERRALRFGRGRPVKLPEEPKENSYDDLKDVSLFDLADYYRKLVHQTGGRTRTILNDEISMEERIDAIIAALRRGDECALRTLLDPKATKVEIVGTFFALLELVKLGRVRIRQTDDFGDIVVAQRDEAPDDEPGEPDTDVPFVEPGLPPVRERVDGADGKKKTVGPRRTHFGGLVQQEETFEEDGEDEADEADEDSLDDAGDAVEKRANSRIDDILKRADDISERFEKSRHGRFRDRGEAGASEGLDQALADLGSELAEEDGSPEADPHDTPPTDSAGA